MRTSSPERIARYRALGWWDDTTLTSLFRAMVDKAPAELALVDPPNRAAFTTGAPLRLDWAELAARATRMRARLQACGIGRGDVVVLQLPNIAEGIFAYLALAELGAVVSPVPMQYGQHELRGIAASVRPRAYLSTRDFRGEDFLATRAAAFDAGVLMLEAAQLDADAAEAIPPAPPPVDADEVFTICWTSGTTGTPKGVPRSHNQWLSQALGMGDIGIEPGMTMLCPFPMVNMAAIAGFLLPWLQYGGRLVLHHPLDVPVFLRQIGAERVSYTIAPPALLEMLLRSPELLAGVDLSGLRVLASGSAPLSPWMVQSWAERHGIGIVNIFGSNEGMALVSCPRDVPDPVKRATLFPRFGVEGLAWSNRIAARIRTRLVDPAGGHVIAAPGTPGELQVQGPNVVDGYHDAIEANREAFDREGWFRTGDLFEIAVEDPRFYRFVGRCKDLIVRGGMKISPAELELLLAAHPRIAEVAVAGYPDEVLGERIGVVAVTRAGPGLELSEIIDFLVEQKIARFKLPEKLVIAAALPRNPLGKVQRAALVQLVVDG